MYPHSSGYPWDNVELRKECESNPQKRFILIPKEELDKAEISQKELKLLKHYESAYEEVEAYWLSYAKNLWSLIQKKPRSEHKEILREIYLVEDFVKMMQDKKTI